MPIEPAEITPAMLDTVNTKLRDIGHDPIELYGLSAAVRDLLNHADTRKAVADAEQREHADMMANLPGWDDMSDLDKGAALMHLWKRDNEGDDYAIENYPAKYIEDPQLTALDNEDACDHAARFEDIAEELDHTEHARLYDLALNHERSSL